MLLAFLNASGYTMLQTQVSKQQRQSAREKSSAPTIKEVETSVLTYAYSPGDEIR